ncbi:hypothetical protein BRO54_0084 [Geobacillus proteiniphilus]|uniref:Uncharacterized protein n=1 Tax=Geobacillus proteiniphilus TaxID=860353 RepID=A0A1Q5TA62_9BACL|nr:hypothetical protein BRO54_0084 [Geobacillus proteiniphilus]
MLAARRGMFFISGCNESTLFFCVTIGSIVGLALPQCRKMTGRLLGTTSVRVQWLSR